MRHNIFRKKKYNDIAEIALKQHMKFVSYFGVKICWWDGIKIEWFLMVYGLVNSVNNSACGYVNFATEEIRL